ncbi:MAG TPA: tol-pal system-associated acyl-CoA thioesterase [Devosia sp.]|nr:tol-pal system-associated acyl-CoA thioesterase [Devosia sp.]
MTRRHRFEVRVYYEDTDFSGNVYHAAYLHFFERGRTEFLRANGIHHSELAKEGIAFAVKSMSIDFARAAHIDDLLVVETSIASLTGARMVLDQVIDRGTERIATARVEVVAIKVGGKAARLPKALLAKFST